MPPRRRTSGSSFCRPSTGREESGSPSPSDRNASRRPTSTRSSGPSTASAAPCVRTRRWESSRTAFARYRQTTSNVSPPRRSRETFRSTSISRSSGEKSKSRSRPPDHDRCDFCSTGRRSTTISPECTAHTARKRISGNGSSGAPTSASPRSPKETSAMAFSPAPRWLRGSCRWDPTATRASTCSRSFGGWSTRSGSSGRTGASIGTPGGKTGACSWRPEPWEGRDLCVSIRAGLKREPLRTSSRWI